MSELLPILSELCDAFGPAGYEDEVRAIIRRQIEPAADEIQETVLGNLIAWKRCPNPRGVLLLDAHPDEVGLIVTSVEPSGLLRFAALGGWDPRVLPASHVTVRARDGAKHRGVIGVLPPHVITQEQMQRAFAIDELFIDLGLGSAEAVAERGISVGAPAVPHSPFAELGDRCVSAKALDNRVGCALIVAAFQALADQELPVDLVGSFSVQEEITAHGARTAAHLVQPDIALVLEGTATTDMPGVPPYKVSCAMRRGPAITIADARTVVPEKMVRFLEGQAQAGGIPFQLKTPRISGTDAGVIQGSGGGVLTGIVSVPCRYIHSATSVLHRDDLECTLALLLRAIENIHTLLP